MSTDCGVFLAKNIFKNMGHLISSLCSNRITGCYAVTCASSRCGMADKYSDAKISLSNINQISSRMRCKMDSRSI